VGRRLERLKLATVVMEREARPARQTEGYHARMTTSPAVRLSPEEYLRIERAAAWKSEYVDGEMFAMAGASPRHGFIVGNVVRELGNQLRETPCNVASADLRVATDIHRHYTYPDVVVICDPLQFVDEHRDTITNPTLIAEVLSGSTQNYDRGEKFERYRAIASLSEYLLVAQDRVHVELYTRQPGGEWLLREWNDLGAEIELVSLRCRLRIDEVYAKVTLDS
jgi:Uma2 family endonuclease